MTTERDRILTRIREALRVPAARPGHHGHEHSPAVEGPVSTAVAAQREIGAWLPLVGPTEEDRLLLFAKQSLELKTDFYLFNTREEMVARVREIAAAEAWARYATHRAPLTDAVAEALQLPSLRTDEPYRAADLEQCAAGITECDVLIAQTGSVFITAKSAGGRALSVLPPHHIVLARREQLLPDLPTAFAFVRTKYAPEYPSFLSVITGPSRTGDIERILVLGAHGPKKLTVLVY
jgi:L-lactate dehydrogenase complex protein LldG